MKGRAKPPATQGKFPDSFSTGATVLVASAGDPSKTAVAIRLLSRYGQSSDKAFVVTTTEGVSETIETIDERSSETETPALEFVDTTSTQPSVPAIYDETPVILTPSPGSLERIVVALAELSESNPPADGNRHLVVRSLTPMLESTSTAEVCTVLDRITGLRSPGGLCLFGIDYTAHDEATIETVAEQVDGVLWVTQNDSDTVQFEYQQTKASAGPILQSRGSDE